MSGPLIFLGLCAVIALSIGGLILAVRAAGPVGRGRPGGRGSTDRSDPLPGWNIGSDGGSSSATDGPGHTTDCNDGGGGGSDCDTGGGGDSGGGDGGGGDGGGGGSSD